MRDDELNPRRIQKKKKDLQLFTNGKKKFVVRSSSESMRLFC